ncbi:MAG: hypothetical protein KY468_14065 [Armatimonadetes bacterium]|nr:hypothetical protein [Armatimonadota bacterium]
MTNHFTDLGFEVAEADDLTELLRQAAHDADEFPLDGGGSLLRWAVGAGIELWIQVHITGELIGVHPFFLGPTRIRFLVESLDATPGGDLDGALMGWVAPECQVESDEESEVAPEEDLELDAPGAYPMRFDLPAYPLATEEVREGVVVELQVAAFADEIALFGNEEEFYAAQDADAQFAVQSFVPLGLFPPGDLSEEDLEEEDRFGEALLRVRGDYQPVAQALFSGTIQRCEKRINPFTQHPFWWLQVKTYRAEYDAVVDPTLLARDPLPGDIVQGQFWMAARITE